MFCSIHANVLQLEDKEVSLNTQNYDLQIMREENQKQKEMLRKADTDRVALEASYRSLTEEKVVSIIS